MTDPGLLRAAALFVPASFAIVAWFASPPPPRRRAGVLLAFVWTVMALAGLQVVNQQAHWWSYAAEGGLFLDMPVDLLLGWAALWGIVAPLAAADLSPWLVGAATAGFDVLIMPYGTPIVRLSSRWLVGEGVAVAGVLAPALVLAGCTERDRLLGARVVLQFLTFTGLLLGVLPAVIMESTGDTWAALAEMTPARGLLWQLLFLAAVPGVSAVQEFVRRGHGTPLPYDPPMRLVTSGPYAYVTNPMQTSMVLVLCMWGLLLRVHYVFAAGIVAVAYSAGLAGWDEDLSMRARFGASYLAYRAGVRSWWPRWRPLVPLAPARLYVAFGCDACSSLGDWVRERSPAGLEIVAAETHPTRDLARLTYEPADGTTHDEGIAALARAVEHVHLGWAVAGWIVRLPLIRPSLQLLVDAVGGGPRACQRRPVRLRRDQ
jgi:protein-S-isoprenylcysteine O-methyltransferase Ste14